MASVAGNPPLLTLHRVNPDASAIIFVVVLGIVAFVVIYPIFLLVVNSFQVGDYGQATRWGMDNWRTTFGARQMREAMVNTITLTAASQAIAFFISVPVAFLIARTDLPGKGWLEVGFWAAVFLPSLTVTLAWILLLDGHRGIVNQLVAKLPFVTKSPFDIFSWWGIVFLHVVTITTAIKVVLLVPAFRNLDASLEEASMTLGTSPLSTLFRIVIPIMMPAILIVFVYGTIRSIQSFEVELILGAPRQIEVYSTLIYHQILQEPPKYGNATVLSLFALALLLPLIALQQWLTHRRSHVTVSGKFNTRLMELGRWRWPVFTAVLLVGCVILIVPFVMVVMATFMKLFGFFSIPDPWTLQHWRTVLQDAKLLPALLNTLMLGAGTALVAVTVFPVIAYLTVRTPHRGRGLLDFLTWLPSAIPGIVIGLGFLWLFLETPLFKSLYGTPFVLIAAVSLGSITISVQIMKSNMLQLGNELEEASRAHGASWLQTFRHVILPLSAPALIAVAALAFGSAAREVSLIALLSTRGIEPLSIYQLTFVTEGRLERASVIGVLIMLISMAVAVAGRLLGVRST